jgi:enoyl-CoA hydratase
MSSTGCCPTRTSTRPRAPLHAADGPTLAHAATKAIVRAVVADGVPAADEIVPAQAGELFATEDLRNAVRSFLEQGPGKATYEGR